MAPRRSLTCVWCVSMALLLAYAHAAGEEEGKAMSPQQHTGIWDSYVKVTNGKFTVDGKPFVFAGWNIWNVLEAAAHVPGGRLNTLKYDGRQMIRKLMNQAVDSGLTVMRMWGHTVTPGHALQPSEGFYDESIFEALDFILEEARVRGLKLIIIFADNWYPTGGIMNYVQWKKGESGTRFDFYTDGEIKKLYKRNILAMLNRRNTKNGRLYKEDPTIMAWNLANEVRCEGCESWVIQSWIDEMATYVKSQDPRHLIGVGYEGFYGEAAANKYRPKRTPGDTWASQVLAVYDPTIADWYKRKVGDSGQNYPSNMESWAVDYVSVHVWPDNWKVKTVTFLQAFIRDHVEDARYLSKPFVLEEFGKLVDEDDGIALRDRYFQAAYDVAEAYALNDGIVQGTLFWHWYDVGVGPGRYGLWVTDSTFDIVRKHATRMNSRSQARHK